MSDSLVEEVRRAFWDKAYDANPTLSDEDRQARVDALDKFDRMIKQVRREAWNEGFDEAADDIGAGELSEMNPYDS